MTRTVSVIAFTIGMVLAWGFPVMPVAAEPGFVWGTAEPIETDDAGGAFAVQVAVDTFRSNIWANRFVPGVGWGTAEPIETEAGSAFNPQVAVDPQGNATAVWSQDIGTDVVIITVEQVNPVPLIVGVVAIVAAAAAGVALLLRRMRAGGKEKA